MKKYIYIVIMCICGLLPQRMMAQSQTPDITVDTKAVSSCDEGHKYVLKNKVENKWLIVGSDGKLTVTDAAPASGASSTNSAYIFTALTENRLDVELDNLKDPFGVNVGNGSTDMQLAPRRTAAATQDPTLQIYDRNGKLIVCYNGVVSFTASTNHANTQWYAYEVHSYTLYEWYWADDCSEAWYRCKCAYCGEVNEEKSLKATITQFAPVAATCTKAAYTSYKATVVLNGEEMTDVKSLSQGQPNGHNYVDGECTVCHMPLITYRVPTYNTEGDPSSGIKSWETRTCPDDAEEVTNSTYFGNGWYYVPAGMTVTFEERVSMPNVHLILCDGSTVNFNEGIEASGGALTIYGQSRNTGRLVATASDGDAIHVESENGITINGGTITATVTSETADGISVADATWRYHGITINGGNVTAVGRGYGSGLNADYDGDASEGTYPHLYINGGTVCAKVDDYESEPRAFRGRAYANRSMNVIEYNCKYQEQNEFAVAGLIGNVGYFEYNNSSYISEATFYTLIPGDLNKDGNVTIADLTQLIQLLNQGGTITNKAADVNKDGSVTVADVEKLRDKVLGIVSPLTEGVFSVSATKKVQFTKGNLWCDASTSPVTYAFETNQYDISNSATYTSSHVYHFFWTTDAANSYVKTYSDGTTTADDVPFFAESKGGLTVAGTSGLYALSMSEWKYLINEDNESSGRSQTNRFAHAKVNGTNGLLIFPDGYEEGTAVSGVTGIATVNTCDAGYPESSIAAETWSTMEANGVVFLPAAGSWDGVWMNGKNSVGAYWSSTPSDANKGCFCGFGGDNLCTYQTFARSTAFSLRLVKTAE